MELKLTEMEVYFGVVRLRGVQYFANVPNVRG